MSDTVNLDGVRAVLDVGFDVASLPLLRERVTAAAVAGGLGDARAADVTIAVHELAANAVKHGPGKGRLALRADCRALCFQVSDAGPGPDTWPVSHAHGLWLVHQVADRVTISSGLTWFRVTAVFDAR